MSYNIAIDGPSGAGKSVLAKKLARKLGFKYVDTGAIYRSVGYYMYEHGIDVSDASAVEDALENVDIRLDYSCGGQQVLVNGVDYGDKIRLPEISMYASAVAAIPAVRKKLLDVQREAAKNHDTVMDGRDIGTVILPDADVKIFLSPALKAAHIGAGWSCLKKELKRHLRRYAPTCSGATIRTPHARRRHVYRPPMQCCLTTQTCRADETLEAALEIVRAKLGSL
jgi:cytidylate kinase